MEKFGEFSGRTAITKGLVLAYKKDLPDAVRNINSMLAALNCFFSWASWSECKVKSICLQRNIYCAEEKGLSKGDIPGW